MWKISGATPGECVTAKAENTSEGRSGKKEERGRKVSEWLRRMERVKGGREKMNFKNSKGAFCPFLHHSVLLLLLFRLSKHHWSLIKPELSLSHNHSDGLRWLGAGGPFQGAFKNDLQTQWPHSAKSSETLIKTIWDFFCDSVNGFFGSSTSIFHRFWAEWANRTWNGLERSF